MSDMKDNSRAGLNIQQASESFPPVDTLRGMKKWREGAFRCQMKHRYRPRAANGYRHVWAVLGEVNLTLKLSLI